MQERRPRTTARAIRSRTIRQDLSFIVSVLLVLAVVVAALTALSSDEAELFGLGDDLHGLAGWAMILLAGLHTLLCGGQMVRYAKRRLRRLLGVGGVIQTEADRGPEESPGRRRPGGVAGGRDGL
jgi:uncharacterized membrane protein